MSNPVPILIADTFGDPGYVTGEWQPVLGHYAWANINYHRSAGAPNTAPHHHGWWCYSQMWPILYRGTEDDEHFHIYLYRFIDDSREEAADELTAFARLLLEQYGCLVWSNSWGGVARGSSLDSAWDSAWSTWVRGVEDLLAEYPRAIACMSSGNDGPKYGGSPVWQFRGAENVWPISATYHNGRPTKFSSQHKDQFACAGGASVFGAHPDKVGYMPWDGTSASCPRVAAIAAYELLQLNSTRDSIRAKLWSQASRPVGFLYDDVWGRGNLEPIYQAIAAGQWERLQAPGATRRMIARMNIWRTTTPLPKPKGRPQ